MRESLTILLSGLMSGVLGVPWECSLLSSQGQHTLYQVSDGKQLLTSIWDSGRQLLSCSLEEDEQDISSFWSRCSIARQDAGGYSEYGGFAEIRMACLVFLQSKPSIGRSEVPHSRAKRGFTYPGTLWCGAGNIADTEDDLGEHRETDSCCRTHDHCQHVIHPFTYTYGYRNFRWHTISHCQCDNQFKDCLRRVNDTASRVVGQAFFNVIQVQCFEFTQKEQCVERHWLGWCNKYVNVTVAEAKDSGLYDYGGKLIDEPALPKESHSTKAPSVELPPESATLGQVMQATEDLLKIMMTVRPSTSPDQSKMDAGKKTKDKTKKKERKNKKGKGLKGKRKKLPQKETAESPAKDIWDNDLLKNEKVMPENQPLDVLDLVPKQDVFNDVLNDEPIRNTEVTTTTLMTPAYKKVELRALTTLPTPVTRPCTKTPLRKNRREHKGKRQRKKKPKNEPCGHSATQ
ncbi:protein PROCA1 [Gastrophryne carolinensis]